MCHQQSLKSACAYAQSDQSLCWSLEYYMIVKLLTEHHLEFLSLKGGCRGLSESTHVKMPHCWKSHATALIIVGDYLRIGLAIGAGMNNKQLGTSNYILMIYTSFDSHTCTYMTYSIRNSLVQFISHLWFMETYTAQLKSSTDFNMMTYFEWTWNILFDVINMYGDLEIYVFSVHQTKGNLVRRQWINVKGPRTVLMKDCP